MTGKSGRTFVTLVDEAVLERVAQIIGGQAAAKRALDDLAQRRVRGEDPVVVQHGAAILVVPRASLIPLSTPPHP